MPTRSIPPVLSWTCRGVEPWFRKAKQNQRGECWRTWHHSEESIPEPLRVLSSIQCWMLSADGCSRSLILPLLTVVFRRRFPSFFFLVSVLEMTWQWSGQYDVFTRESRRRYRLPYLGWHYCHSCACHYRCCPAVFCSACIAGWFLVGWLSYFCFSGESVTIQVLRAIYLLIDVV